MEEFQDKMATSQERMEELTDKIHKAQEGIKELTAAPTSRSCQLTSDPQDSHIAYRPEKIGVEARS